MERDYQPGTVLLEKYRVESVLGRGGMGVVLRVTHLHLGEELAIKILAPEAAVGPDAHARFLREAQSAVRLRGEHVTRVSDVGVLPEGAPYIAMEYLRGVDLAGELAGRGVLLPGDAVDYVLQACEALAEAHALGIVHRDIKPSNLFLTHRPDGTPLVKVLDFGISKAPAAGPGLLTRTDTVMGTPGYMSPEQMKASKDVDARTDIWALGIVLYECLSGRRPFDAESFSAVVLRAATEPPPPMDPWIPRALQAAVLRCLEKDRAVRFQSTAELAAALAPFARDARAAGIVVERTSVMFRRSSSIPVPQGARFGQPPTATTLSGSAGMARTPSRRRRYAIGGAVAALGAIAALSAVGASGASHPDGSAADAAPGSAEVVVAQPSDAAQDAPQAVAITPAPQAAIPTVEHARIGSDGGRVQQTASHCLELAAMKDWGQLRDCATELAALGAKDRAEEFRARAAREAGSEAAATKVQSALREGDLRGAQTQLKTIGADSVYFAASRDAFTAAEARAVEDNRRRAQDMASARDCAALKRLQVQLGGSGTPAVTAAVAAVTCVEPVAVAPPAPPPPPPSPTPSTPRPPLAPGPARQPSGAGSNASPGAPPPRDTLCAKMNVEDVMDQAGHQFSAGFARPALQLILKALDCKQSIRMYRMAALYACVAHDAPTAQLYYSKLSAQYQPGIEQRCQQEGIFLLQ